MGRRLIDGQEPWLPPDAQHRSNRELLEWHGDETFQRSEELKPGSGRMERGVVSRR